MNFKSLMAGLCTALTVSLSQAAPVYSVVYGQNVDLYYDAAAFGNDVIADGDSFFFKKNGVPFAVQGSAYVVAHENVALYGEYGASFNGDYEFWYGQYAFAFGESTKGNYYSKNPQDVPKDNSTYSSFREYGDGDDLMRKGSFTHLIGGYAEWSNKAEFYRIDMTITLLGGMDSKGGPPGDYGYLNIDGFSFNFRTASVVPEPTTYAMLLGGLAFLTLRARRRQS